jgi:hypothetical protein
MASTANTHLTTTREDFMMRFLLAPLWIAFCLCANVNAQERAIALPHVLSAAQEYLAKSNLGASRYFLTSVEKKTRVVASARSAKSRAVEYYEVWWVSADKQRSRYLGLMIPSNGKIQRLRSSASLPKSRGNVGRPKISLRKALRLSEAYALDHSLATSAHYLHSASLVTAGRSLRDIYWCVRLRDGKVKGTEENDILLAVRMDGTVERLHLT